MRNTPLKGLLKKSPLRDPDPKKAKTYSSNDYSPKATKGTVGDKIANAVTPKSLIDIIPVGKAFKGAKAIVNYLRA